MPDFGLITDPVFYAWAIPACLIVGIAKGGLGGGLSMLGVPLMAFAISPSRAAAILLPILCVMDLAGLIAYRKTADRRSLILLLPAACFGTAVGMVAFGKLDDTAILFLIGMISILFTLRHWFLPTPVRTGEGPGAVTGGVLGFISGFTSFIAHAGGPPVQMYLLPQRLERTVYVGTTVWFFTLINLLKLGPYAALGLFSTQNLGTSLVLAPLAPLGIWIGYRLLKLIPEGAFYKFSWAMLFLTGLKLTYDALVGWGLI